MSPSTSLFLLGGHDLEMLEIGRLVRETLGEAAVVDKDLPWHAAAASAYRAEIEAAVAAGATPVLVELRDDLPPALSGRCVQVDHHGERAGADQPTSLEQVFALLGLPQERWTRRHALVACVSANTVATPAQASPIIMARCDWCRSAASASAGVTSTRRNSGADMMMLISAAVSPRSASHSGVKGTCVP